MISNLNLTASGFALVLMLSACGTTSGPVEVQSAPGAGQYPITTSDGQPAPRNGNRIKAGRYKVDPSPNVLTVGRLKLPNATLAGDGCIDTGSDIGNSWNATAAKARTLCVDAHGNWRTVSHETQLMTTVAGDVVRGLAQSVPGAISNVASSSIIANKKGGGTGSQAIGQSSTVVDLDFSLAGGK